MCLRNTVFHPIGLLLEPAGKKEKLLPAYMKVDKITGPMATAPYKGWFDLKTWAQVVSPQKEYEPPSKSPGLSHQPIIMELKEAHISKNSDAGLPLLAQLSSSGQLRDVTIVFVRLEGCVSSELMRLKYKDAFLSSYQIGADGIREELTFVSDEMVIEKNSY
jgi:type VI protein secretion system component Hcp